MVSYSFTACEAFNLQSYPDPDAESLASKLQEPQKPALEYPDPDDDHDWDDDLDAEGEIDTNWAVDNDDDVSNQSSTTLSSTISIAKRGHHELDSADEPDDDGQPPHTNSPSMFALLLTVFEIAYLLRLLEPKRPRVA